MRMAKRCPDCDVPLEETEYDTTTGREKIRLHASGGLKAALGVGGRQNVYAYVCPECSLVRFYAE